MKRIPDEILNELSFRDKGRSIEMSSNMELILYERGDTILSNYDFTISYPEVHSPDLSIENMWLVWCKKKTEKGEYVKWAKISDEMILYETDMVNQFINELEIETQNCK
jgi:hypothetical protein